jgi:hypothetical protein
MPDAVDMFMKQREASASVEPVGSIRIYMMLELKEMEGGAMVSASNGYTVAWPFWFAVS